MKIKLQSYLNELRNLQTTFHTEYEVDDIFSNSKIYEFLISNRFGHDAIPGHSGSRDALDSDGNEIEYKHYKESSSNHTWTFNDYSDTTIKDLKTTTFVYFVYVDNVNYPFPGQVKWYYKCSGEDISNFLSQHTPAITNKRKMINISRKNLNSIGYKKIHLEDFDLHEGIYGENLFKIIEIISKIEKATETTDLLTSNKIWELVVALELNHSVNSEQGGRAGAHDAYDEFGNLYEYKVSKNSSWNFQDISDNVLEKYLEDHKIILAVVDKTKFIVKDIYSADPQLVVNRLRVKLEEKRVRFEQKGKQLRRLQVSLSKGDLKLIKAKKVL